MEEQGNQRKKIWSTYLGTEGTLSGLDGTPGTGRDGRDGGALFEPCVEDGRGAGGCLAPL